MSADTTPAPPSFEKGTPWVTYMIVAANVLVFLIEVVLSGSLQPSDAVLGSFAASWATTLPHYVNGTVSSSWGAFYLSMFSHASVDHILGNLTFFWVFSKMVEEQFHYKGYGHAGYFVFYVMGGTVAAAFFGLSDPYGYFLGASGAIAFVLGAFWFCFPGAVVKLGSRQVKAFYFLGTWFALQTLFTLIGAQGGVAYGAHVGGFLFGMFVAWGFRLVKFRNSAFGLLEEPWHLDPNQEFEALQALLAGDTPESVTPSE